MLNGLDPLLVIVFGVAKPKDIFGPPAPTTGLDDALSWVGQNLGVPIPIYLSEKITGIYVDSETRALDVQTQVEAQIPTGPTAIAQAGNPPAPLISQQVLDAQLTVNLLARTDCILLTALLALMDQILARVVTKEYQIHYLNGPTAIFGAVLHRFSNSVSKNDDLVRIEMVLGTAQKQPPTPKAVQDPIPNSQGVKPLA